MKNKYTLIAFIVTFLPINAYAEITQTEIQTFVNAHVAAFKSCNPQTINAHLDSYFTDGFSYNERYTETESQTVTKAELKQTMVDLFASAPVAEIAPMVCNPTITLGQIKPLGDGVAFQTLEQQQGVNRYCVSYAVMDNGQFKLAKSSCTYKQAQ